jgi:hypothetical protein
MTFLIEHGDYPCRYVYMAESYRNEQRQPRNRRVRIGVVDPESGERVISEAVLADSFAGMRVPPGLRSALEGAISLQKKTRPELRKKYSDVQLLGRRQRAPEAEAIGPRLLMWLSARRSGLWGPLMARFPETCGDLLDFSSSLAFSLGGVQRLSFSGGGFKAIMRELSPERASLFFEGFAGQDRSPGGVLAKLPGGGGLFALISEATLAPVWAGALEAGSGPGRWGLPPSRRAPALFLSRGSFSLSWLEGRLSELPPEVRVLAAFPISGEPLGFLEGEGIGPLPEAGPSGALAQGAFSLGGRSLLAEVFPGSLERFPKGLRWGPEAQGPPAFGPHPDMPPSGGEGGFVIVTGPPHLGGGPAVAGACARAQLLSGVLERRLNAIVPPGETFDGGERGFVLFLALTFALSLGWAAAAAGASDELYPEGLLEDFRRFSRVRQGSSLSATRLTPGAEAVLAELGLSPLGLRRVARGLSPFGGCGGGEAF